MNNIIVILRLLLFFISFTGLCEILRSKSGIEISFIPALTVCTEVSVLFAAGILNCMLPAALIMYLGGLAAFVYFTVKKKAGFFRTYASPAFLFILLVFTAEAVFLWGQTFFDYDNFSHWALVVKTMLRNNRFPNFMDKIIEFQEYPLGSSVFIWFFARMVSEAEHIQMLAQQFMVLCFSVSVFRYVKRRKALIFAAFLLMMNFLLCYNIVIEDLLVDTLLGVQGAALALMMVSECVYSEKKVSFLWTIPYSITAVQIKNSGVFFAAFVCVTAFWLILKEKRDIKSRSAAILAPMLSFYLWHAHCKYVFTTAFFSRHAMTTNMMLYTFREKSADDIRFITHEVFKLGFTGKDLLLAVIFTAAVAAIWLICGADRKTLGKIVAALAVVYVLYIVGMLLMYLFSMPYTSGGILAAYDRYRQTILILVYLVDFAAAARAISQAEGKKAGTMSVLLIAAVCFVWLATRPATIFKSYSGIERVPVQTAIDSAEIPDDAECLVVIPELDGNYTFYITKYILLNNNVDVVALDAFDESSLADYEYLIMPYESTRTALGYSEAVHQLS